MENAEVALVGRSSSHFTRTARLFALELGVPHRFEPVLDLTSTAPAVYADNPALKVPILVDQHGPLYGTENICRELVRRSGLAGRVVLRGQVGARVVANAEEMVLHAMSAEVNLIMLATPATRREPPKVRRSLENALAFVDVELDRALAALPGDRALSFLEAALFSLATHLPFRDIMDVGAYARICAFRDRFATRPSARATEYRFDAAV
jgi:glutathione S-transferase